MRNLLFSLFVVAILVPFGLMAQTVTLTFTAKDGNDHWIQLDRVVVTNLTKSWQETIYWPDTTLTMQNGTFIAESVDDGGFSLSQNNPNPFNGTTDVRLTVKDAGTVTLDITNVRGQTVKTQNFMSLQAGTHTFRIHLSVAGTFMVSARQNGKTSSVKMINNGDDMGEGIDQVSIVEIPYYEIATEVTSKYGIRGNTANPFNFGDVMEYVGYALINGEEFESQRITQAQGASQTFVLSFSEAQNQLPTVSTEMVTGITAVSAIVGGNVNSDGGDVVIDRGVCWDSIGNPTLNDNCLHCGSGMGTFSGNLTELTPGRTYYVRAYAINSVGTGYGNIVSFTTAVVNPQDGDPCPGIPSFTDIDSNTYNTVWIGSQCWMRENLCATKYPDSTPIPQYSSSISEDVEAEYWCYPDNNPSNKPTHGLLYSWTSVMHNSASSEANPSGVQGVCPDGWHVPSDAEWMQLFNYVSSQSQYWCNGDSTYITKSLASTTGWNSTVNFCGIGNNQGANNATGFSALPAGSFCVSCNSLFGDVASFWCATGYENLYAYCYGMNRSSPWVNKDHVSRNRGYSVRCVRD